MNRRLLTGLLLALAAGARGAEADWPQFRGPGGQGHASGTIPLEGTTLPSPTYKVAVPGKGW